MSLKPDFDEDRFRAFLEARFGPAARAHSHPSHHTSNGIATPPAASAMRKNSAPRVVAERVDHWLGRFEAHEGALDMGPERARVKPGSRVPYVPTATVAVDVAAAREAGGFDESLRTGEDVDFVRRLGAAGHGCLYDPTLRVGHLPRRGVAAVARRRFAYGASAQKVRSMLSTPAPATSTG